MKLIIQRVMKASVTDFFMGKIRKRKDDSPAVSSAKKLVNKYKKSKKLSPKKVTNVKRALYEVKEKKVSIKKASLMYNLSYGYLYRRLSGEVDIDARNGPQPVFSAAEEEAMARWCAEMAERGMGLKTGEFLDFVHSVVVKEKRKTPFKDGRPGYDWYHAFMERNAHIVKPTFEKELESSRAKVSKDQTDVWYGKFRDFLKGLNLLDKPNRIYNADETGFSMGSKPGKVIGPQWLKQVPHISGGRSKERYSVMFTACADGKMLPPFFVYPEPKPRGFNPLHGTIEGSELVYTKKGWMNAVAFSQYLKHFHQNANNERPVVLLIDSVSSHIDFSVFEEATSYGIEIYRLLPNSTHIMQPLDVGVFGSLKIKWYKSLRAHNRQHPGEPVQKHNFPEKLKEAFLEFYKPLTIINSFKEAGIYPVDGSVVKNLKPSLTFTCDEREEESDKDVPETAVTKLNETSAASSALEAFKSVLSTPTQQKYDKRLEEGYDLVGASPCFDAYKKLYQKVGYSVFTSKAEQEYKIQSTPKTSSSLTTSHHSCGLDLLAEVATDVHERQDTSLDTSDKDISEKQLIEISPVLKEALVFPAVKEKSKKRRRMLDSLPDNVTSDSCIKQMAMKELEKIKSFAKRERKAKQQYMHKQQSPISKKKKITTKSNTKKTKNLKMSVTKSTRKDLPGPSSSKIGKNVQESDIFCVGCYMNGKRICQKRLTEHGSNVTVVTKERTSSEKITVPSQTLPLFSVENSVIKGYHEYKIRPPRIDPPHNYRLYVEREYTNIEDVNACLVWLPSLETYPEQYHDIVTDEKKGYKLVDIAGLPVGHVPRGLAGSFRKILDSNGVIYAECVGDPLPSFPPWPAPNEKGGGVVIPCHYYVEGRESNKSEYLKFVKNSLLEMPEGEFMRLGI